MKKLKFDYTRADKFLSDREFDYYISFINKAHEMLHTKKGQGSDFTGWVNLPDEYDRSEFERIKSAAKKIKSDSEALVVIGIGGSYLGARAAIEMLTHSFYNNLSNQERKTPQIYFAGNNLSSVYLADLFEILKDKDISVNVISKSGTTTEPAVAFRLFKNYMEQKYGRKKAAERIYATTDKGRGALLNLSSEEGYETFVIPDDVGGRFSVLTAVGLLPIAAAGLDIDKIMKGAADALKAYNKDNLLENDCYKYAVARNILYNKNKSIEIMVNYEPALHYFTEWWKQLYGESEGKDKKGIFPAGVDFTTDLHSMGQYIQDGLRNVFETVLKVESVRKIIKIEEAENDLDGLNYLAGKNIDYVNLMAMEGTIQAHTEGDVPNLVLNVPELNEYYFGNLVYFFEKACGISGYLLGVNPFDQPGVEKYKKNMFRLLGKPGY